MKLRNLLFILILLTNFCWRSVPPFEIKTEKINGKRYFYFENERNFEIHGIEVGEVEVLKPGEYKPYNPMWSVDIRKNHDSGVIFEGRFEYGDDFQKFIESKALSKAYTSTKPKPLIEGKKYEIGIVRYVPINYSVLEFVH
jgi:hypothetical protein